MVTPSYLLLADLDPLLEGDGEVVLAGVHGLGDAGVGPVGANNEVNGEGLGGAHAGSGRELLVVEGVLGVLVLLVVAGDVDAGDEPATSVASFKKIDVNELELHSE